jgi:diguanylate cyclase (GGDEF)-like protein/PAS domain S-box-containing protein
MKSCAMTGQLISQALGPEAYAAILEGVSEGVYVTDRDRRVLYWNPACEALTGYEANEAVGSHCSDDLLNHVDAAGRPLCLDGCPMAATLDDGEPREAEVYLHHRQGHRVPVRLRTRPIRSASGEIVAAVETFTSIADKAAALEQIRELEGLVYIDALTGVANRRFLEQNLASRIDEAGRYGWTLGLVMIDIDNFKAVNDTYGHEVGDLVLRMVARTLQGATRSFDVVGRWGGEEFVAILANTSADDLARIAERYRALVEKSDLPIDGGALRVTISAGATAAHLGESGSSALARADELLYVSKQQGRNRVTFERVGRDVVALAQSMAKSTVV